MKLYAHVADGTVREMISLDDDLVPGKDVFTPAFAAGMVDVTAVSPQPAPGWAYDGKAFSAPAALPAPPREATSYALVAVLSDDEVAALGKAKAKDQHLFGKRNDAWPEDNPKIKRLTDALGTTPKAWFDRVFAPAS